MNYFYLCTRAFVFCVVLHFIMTFSYAHERRLTKTFCKNDLPNDDNEKLATIIAHTRMIHYNLIIYTVRFGSYIIQINGARLCSGVSAIRLEAIRRRRAEREREAY